LFDAGMGVAAKTSTAFKKSLFAVIVLLPVKKNLSPLIAGNAMPYT
jgi:hypothetical protein